MAGAGVEGAAAAVGDARIGGEAGCIGAARERDAFGGGQIVDVVRVDAQVARELAEAGGIGQVRRKDLPR